MGRYKNKSGGQGQHAQRGVAALLTAIFMLTAVLFLVLVVDSGRLYYEKRSLQRVADMAALDAASQSGACGGLSGGTSVAQAAQASATRNGYTSSLANSPNSVTQGDIAVTGGLRAFSASPSASSQAVQVIATNAVPASLIAGGIYGNTVTLSATAVAERTPSATFGIGSGLLTLNSGVSPLLSPVLNGLLRSNVNLSAVSYNGVVNSNVSLLSMLNAIKVQAGVGSIQDVLDSNIGLISVVQATANLMSQSADSTVATVGANLLSAPLANISALTVDVGQLLGLQAGQAATSAQLNSSVNLFNFLLANAELANQNSAVALNLAVPNVTSASLTVIQPPTLASGPVGTKASNGQVALDLVINPSLNLGIAGTALDMDVRVMLADGTATLLGVSCSTLASPTTTATIGAVSSLGTIVVGSAKNISNPASLSVTLLGVNAVSASLSVDPSSIPSVASGTQNLNYVINRSYGSNGLPMNSIAPSATQTVSSSVALNPAITINSVSVLNNNLLNLLGLGSILNGVLGSLNTGTGSPVAAALDNLLSSVLNTLGIQIGYSDVTLYNVSEPGAVLII